MLVAMALFALVHGSMHGGFCWRDLVPELERLGHRAVAPDLPCDDVAAGLGEYADAVEASLAGLPGGDAPILVGHSLGSRTIPVVASRRPRSRMIFLCSVPTGPGAVDANAFAGMVTAEYAGALFHARADGARRIDAEAAKRVFFGECEAQTADWAASRLRWQGPRPLAEPAPIPGWPAVPLDIVLARDDRAVRFDWARVSARSWLGRREPKTMPGDHSPFLSRPAELARTLVGCLDDRGDGGRADRLAD
jgi:pimeloyl-ACP methyl ester carboxylesterase